MRTYSPAQAIADMFKLIYDNDLTTMSGGNISIKEPQGDYIWISPSGTDKGALTGEQVVRVHMDGTAEGDFLPSMELPFHLSIYETAPHVGAVIHVHAPYLLAASLLHTMPLVQMIPALAEVTGKISMVPYETPGSTALSDAIAHAFALGSDCAILKNHGVVVTGKDLAEAFLRLEALNIAFQIEEMAAVLGPVRIPLQEQMPAALWHPEEPPLSPAASIPAQLPENMFSIIRRMIQKKLALFNPAIFCMSYRLEDGWMLTNPAHLPLFLLEEADLLPVAETTVHTYHQKIHLDLYKRNPKLQCLVTSMPPGIMAYAVTGMPFSLSYIPESATVLRSVVHLPYNAFAKPQQLAEAFTPATGALMIENGCCICGGSTFLQAYDRLEVLTYSAKALIDAQRMGVSHPITEQQMHVLQGDAVEKFVQ